MRSGGRRFAYSIVYVVIAFAGTCSVTFSVASIYARVHAPNGTVNITGSTPFVGSIVAKDLNVNGSGIVSYNSSLPIPGGSGSTGGIVSYEK